MLLVSLGSVKLRSQEHKGNRRTVAWRPRRSARFRPFSNIPTEFGVFFHGRDAYHFSMPGIRPLDPDFGTRRRMDKEPIVTNQSQTYHGHSSRRVCGFTTTELIVVMGLIIVLLAIILPAVRSVRAQAIMSQSMNNMRQVATFMQIYAKDNREHIVPSRFDYSDDVFSYKGLVASDPNIPSNERHRGTWADILWTVNEVGRFPGASEFDSINHDYRTKAPDRALYEQYDQVQNNPFRSAAVHTRTFVRDAQDDVPDDLGQFLPQQVQEEGLPGYFAANNFFDAAPDEDNPTGRWYTTGQIRSPERSMYLVDSVAGAIIRPVPQPFDTELSAGGVSTLEVDFRYNGVCLMLFLDGSVAPQNRWVNVCDLECHPDPVAGCDCGDPNYTNRGMRISDPTRR